MKISRAVLTRMKGTLETRDEKGIADDGIDGGAPHLADAIRKGKSASN